jgi:hypothetical protein
MCDLKIILDGELPTLNEYSTAERANKFKAGRIKKIYTNIVADQLMIQRIKEITKPIKIIFNWYCKNKRQDPDNIVFAKKYILDGLVKRGTIKNDGWKQIKGFEDNWFVDKNHPRVELLIHFITNQ